MALTLIIGPMKSGKSHELIARTMPLIYANKQVLRIKPANDTRNTGINSRTGASAEATAYKSLRDVPLTDVIAVDEVHMYEPEEAKHIEAWVRYGCEVVICGLDTGYKAELFPVVRRVLELKPDEIVIKKAVCDVCKQYNAIYTQILNKDTSVPFTEGLPRDLTEDGRYAYEARCRNCFVKK